MRRLLLPLATLNIVLVTSNVLMYFYGSRWGWSLAAAAFSYFAAAYCIYVWDLTKRDSGFRND